jgi:methionyl-tRNA formyltransferase
LKIEMIMVVGWEERIPLSVYRSLRHGGWNVHPSLLPAYRGHNPFFHVLKNRENRTGITVHRLTDELDAGPILLQRSIAIPAEETLGALWRRLNRLGAEAAVEALRMINRGETRTMEQPEGEHPRAPRVAPRDLLLDATRTVEEALALVRAANPFYGAAWTVAGETVKVFEAHACDAAGGDMSARLIIPLADGAIEATVIEVEGWGYSSGVAWQAMQRRKVPSVRG